MSSTMQTSVYLPPLQFSDMMDDLLICTNKVKKLYRIIDDSNIVTNIIYIDHNIANSLCVNSI
jgi:hypothetical protein